MCLVLASVGRFVDYRCHFCGQKVYRVQHIDPWSERNNHSLLPDCDPPVVSVSPDRKVIACRQCSRRKSEGKRLQVTQLSDLENSAFRKSLLERGGEAYGASQVEFCYYLQLQVDGRQPLAYVS